MSTVGLFSLLDYGLPIKDCGLLNFVSPDAKLTLEKEEELTCVSKWMSEWTNEQMYSHSFP